jgi:tight adherence protein B
VMNLLLAAAAGGAVLAAWAGSRRLRRRSEAASVYRRLGAGLRLGDRPRAPLLEGVASRVEATSWGRYLAQHAARSYPGIVFSDALAWLVSGSIAGALVGWLLFGGGPPAVLSALAGPVVVDRALARHEGRRARRREHQLPEALFVQSAALRAGNSLVSSLRAVAGDVSEPLSGEISDVLRELDLGVSLDAALESMVARIGGRDVDLWVTAMLVHRQTGGNLAGVSEALAARMRERADMRAELRTLTAQGRLSGVVVAVAPLVFFAVLSVTSREQMAVLYSTPLGLVLLMTGLAMEVLGFLWIRRILRIKE